MKNEDIGDSIMRGLEEAVKHAEARRKGDVEGQKRHSARQHRLEVSPVNVAELRTSLGMTQMEFARSFGFKLSSVRNWEQGQRIPRGPSVTLLLLIQAHPEAMLSMMRGLPQERVFTTA